MAKLPSMKRTSKAKSKGKATTAEDEMPLPQAVSKPHARKPKPSETKLVDRAAKDRDMAAKWLMRRDGMDEDTATLVVNSMEPADVVQLNIEAADAVIDKSRKLVEQGSAPAAPAAPSAPAASPAATPANATVPEAEEVAVAPVDFVEVEGLVANEEFPQLVIECRDAAVDKNKKEKEYKEKKKRIDVILADAGIDKLHPVMCLGVRLVRYTGKSPRFLDPLKLLAKGVSIDIINQCYSQGEYNDVRVTTPDVEA